MKIGIQDISKVYLGTEEASKVYLGLNSVYEKSSGGGGIDQNTIVCMHFDDSFTDSSQYASTFDNGLSTYSLVPAYGTGHFGKCFTNFSSTGVNYTDITNSTAFNMLSDEITVDYWFYWDGGGNKSGVDLSLYPNDGGRLSFGTMSYYRGSLIFNALDNDVGSYFSAVKTNDWNHLACVIKSSTNAKFYLNGVLTYTANHSVNFTNGIYMIRIQMNNDATYCNPIDELRISNVARWNSDFEVPTEPYS